MNVTREVVTDLLPIYFAGEASGDTTVLVEDYFRQDPDFERIARTAATPLETLRAARPLAPSAISKRGDLLYRGPAIVIEAVNPTEPLKFGKSLSLDDAAELERLRSDGHKLRPGDRNHAIEPTLESCRATQLYRTMPHELGHWVDFLEKVERPFAKLRADEDGDGYGVLLDRFHSRPNREKEHFAHTYAERLREHLGAIRAIPFDRELDREQLMQDGLRLQDFIFPSQPNEAKDS